MGLFKDMPKVMPQIRIPIFSMFDITTGSISKGKKGEHYCNGGLPNLVMISGRGNSFKSTIGNFMLLSAASRVVESGYLTDGLVYDTELTYSIDRFEALANNIEFLPKNIITGEESMWTITSPGSTVEDKDTHSEAKYTADKFVEDLRKALEDKSKEKNSLECNCMLNPYNAKESLKIKVPAFVMVDSISELNSENIDEMLSGNLDNSSTNTYAMKQGGFRSKFLITLPPLLSRSNSYMVLVAQQGNKIDMDANMYKPKDPGLLKHLKEHQTLKGVGSKSSFLTSILWTAEKEESLQTKNSKNEKIPMYPKDGSDSEACDLNVVWLKTARSKSGLSGIMVPIVVSQYLGVMPHLSEFHYLMINKRYGMSGNDREFFLDLYPDVKITRKNIRKLLSEDPLLRRAVNITAELLLAKTYQKSWLDEKKVNCEPKELYEDIKKLGYDWNELLATRGYWLAKQYECGKFLSVYDLLLMRVNEYTPYFIKGDKK